MANLAVTSNGYMDGSVALLRNNDIVQVAAISEGNKDEAGKKVYIPV
ncbi:unnamed protein product, partial [marine sediment metagenome]